MNITSDIETEVRRILFRNVELSNRVSSLEAEIKALHERLSRQERPEKDSHNSSIPSGRESLKALAVCRTRSLRTASGRSSGGHKGSTLLMSHTRDETKTHIPAYCTRCGQSLSEVPGREAETRQRIDVPFPVCPVVTKPCKPEEEVQLRILQPRFIPCPCQNRSKLWRPYPCACSLFEYCSAYSL